MSPRKISRRAFLEATAAATIATQLKPARAQSKTEEAYPENGTLIPDEGWHLWIDEHAEWKSDTIFLPEDVTQDEQGIVNGKGVPLPVNPPTGGWGALTADGSKEVILPTTVEQHYWGKFGSRPYTQRSTATPPTTPSPRTAPT